MWPLPRAMRRLGPILGFAAVAVWIASLLVAVQSKVCADAKCGAGGYFWIEQCPTNKSKAQFCCPSNKTEAECCQPDPPPSCEGPACAGPAGGGGGTAGGSIDPNDKLASQGVTAARFLSGEEPLRYVVTFENLETASLPAQTVVITDQLDLARLDPTTFSLGPVSFGDTTILPPPGLTHYTKDVDLPDRDLVVRLDAGLDSSSGLVTWRFVSLDPLTLQATQDPLAGFLPPNANPPEGDGSVLFTIKPRHAIPAGTQICNQANIVFDVNAPIETPRPCNAIDTTKPASQVLSLASTQTSPRFDVSWSGTDEGSGISDYSVFVSEDSGPFTVVLANTSATSTTFGGQFNKTYAFYTTARDRTGNVEDALGKTPATTRVVATAVDTTPPVISALDDVIAEATSAAGAVVDYSSPSTYDAVDGPGVAICSPVSGSTFVLGDTTVECSAQDVAGNRSTGEFHVIVRDTTAPALLLPAPIVAEATGPGGAAVSFLASARDTVDGALTAQCSPASGSMFAPGTTNVACSAADSHGNTSTGSLIVTVRDTTPPVLTLTGPSPLTVDCHKPFTDPGATAYDLVAGDLTSAIQVSGRVEPNVAGTYTLTYTVSDGVNRATAVRNVHVKAQSISSPVASPSILWPPNHKMINVSVTLDLADSCNALSTCEIVSVTSNELVDGLGDGDTAPDWNVTGKLNVQLRAERSGRGPGRTYTVVVQCRDVAGTATLRSVTVLVPRNR